MTANKPARSTNYGCFHIAYHLLETISPQKGFISISKRLEAFRIHSLWQFAFAPYKIQGHIR